jgi:Aldo/keto reductase family/Thermophilic metalloprotease (M29)
MMFGYEGNGEHDECLRMIDVAIENGINFIDTADAYSDGESEQIVGRAQAQAREQGGQGRRRPRDPHPLRRPSRRRDPPPRSCRSPGERGLGYDYDMLRPGTREALPINRSATHVNFMIGGPELTVTGINRDGARRIILAGEWWALDP